MRRVLAGLVGLIDLGNGLVMLIAPARWYDAVPGVHGGFNAHFVQDVGAAFLAAGVGLVVRALRPQWWAAAATGSLFLGIHALLHLIEWGSGHAEAPLSDLLLVVAPAVLAGWASLPGDGVAWPVSLPSLGTRPVQAALRAFGRRYDYDTAYLESLWKESPLAFLKFSLLQPVSFHREAVPVSAWFAAKLVGALAEDCGPCTQLVVNMAREAKVSADQLQAILRRETSAMDADTRLGFDFADAVVRRTAEEDTLREAVAARWGARGVVDLSLALAVGRVYPMTKAGLGFARECRLVVLEGTPVAVVHA